jgi:hypothetical protein
MAATTRRTEPADSIPTPEPSVYQFDDACRQFVRSIQDARLHAQRHLEEKYRQYVTVVSEGGSDVQRRAEEAYMNTPQEESEGLRNTIQENYRSYVERVKSIWAAIDINVVDPLTLGRIATSMLYGANSALAEGVGIQSVTSAQFHSGFAAPHNPRG